MRVLLMIGFLIGTFGCFAQDFEECNDIELEKEQDYRDTEDLVLECANYLYNHEPNEISTANKNATLFLISWATGAPYSFQVWVWGTKLAEKEPALLIIYMAVLVKVGLQHDLFEGREANIKAAEMMYDYVKNEPFEMKRKGYLKKFIKAGDKGELAEFINA